MVHSPSFTETHREYYLTQIEEAVNTIVGIALLAEEGYHRIISIGCLFSIALMDYLTDDFSKRQLILDLIHKHQRMTGWPASSVVQALQDVQAIWVNPNIWEGV